MILYILLLLTTVFTAVVTGAILAATYKDSGNKHWAWLTAIVVLVFVSILIVNYSKEVNAIEITRARMSAGETGKWVETKNKEGEVTRIFEWRTDK